MIVNLYYDLLTVLTQKYETYFCFMGGQYTLATFDYLC
jgi:hypothetical protein